MLIDNILSIFYKQVLMSAILEKTSSFSKLHKKIKSKECIIAIFGLGYVGMPLLLTIGQKNIKTIGFDISESKVNAFNNSEPFLKDLDIETLRKLQKQKLTHATLDPHEIKNADVIIICVPTPLTQNLDPDTGYIQSATQIIADNLQKGQLIVLESTTFPGTSEEIVTPILEKSGLKSGLDFFVAYSPERKMIQEIRISIQVRLQKLLVLIQKMHCVLRQSFMIYSLITQYL